MLMGIRTNQIAPMGAYIQPSELPTENLPFVKKSNQLISSIFYIEGKCDAVKICKTELNLI